MPEHRRIENAAFALPVFGAALIFPPIINVFNVEVRLFGVPLEVYYVFGVWMLLILAAFRLSRLLPRAERPPDPPADGPGAS
ncbi:MAG TPA: hypothetical protein VIL84_06010 [Devosiaceae bacterium]